MGASKTHGGLVKVSGPQYCTQARAEPMQVLVVGMFRTGTTSITTALKVLGYKVFGDRDIYHRDFGEFFRRASTRKYKNGGGIDFGLEQWESIFATSTAVVGHAGSSFTDELLAAYPEAKIILTTRDEDAWLSSMISTTWGNYVGWLSGLVRLNRRLSLFPPTLFSEGLHTYYEEVFWNDLPAHGRRVFREHNAHIKRAVPPERLLVYDVREGWEPICRFLQKPMPKTDFPNLNDQSKYRKEMFPHRVKLTAYVLIQLLMKVVVTSLVIAALWKVWLLWRAQVIVKA